MTKTNMCSSTFHLVLSILEKLKANKQSQTHIWEDKLPKIGSLRHKIKAHQEAWNSHHHCHHFG